MPTNWTKLANPTTNWTVDVIIGDWFETLWFYGWFTADIFLPSSLPVTAWTKL